MEQFLLISFEENYYNVRLNVLSKTIKEMKKNISKVISFKEKQTWHSIFSFVLNIPDKYLRLCEKIMRKF